MRRCKVPSTPVPCYSQTAACTWCQPQPLLLLSLNPPSWVLTHMSHMNKQKTTLAQASSWPDTTRMLNAPETAWKSKAAFYKRLNGLNSDSPPWLACNFTLSSPWELFVGRSPHIHINYTLFDFLFDYWFNILFSFIISCLLSWLFSDPGDAFWVFWSCKLQTSLSQ
jgi:hypothetical protein